MSEEESTTSLDLVERVRVLLDAGDRQDWDAAMEFFAPTAVWVAIDTLETFTEQAIRDFWTEWYAPYEDVRIEMLETVDLGGGVVMAVIRQSGRLGDAPSRIQQDAVLVYEWSKGLIDRVTTYSDPGEARAVAKRLAEERA